MIAQDHLSDFAFDRLMTGDGAKGRTRLRRRRRVALRSRLLAVRMHGSGLPRDDGVLRPVVIVALRVIERVVQPARLLAAGGALDQQRVYMLTLPPTPEYRALTGHDRMPALINQDVIIPLDQGNQQVALGS